MSLVPGLNTRNIIFLILVSVALFANTFQNQFVWDDQDVIVDNRYIRNLGNAFKFFTPEYWQDYRSQAGTRYLPLRTLSFALDYAVWELNVFGYHLTNLALHISNVILVYFLALQVYGMNKEDAKIGQAEYFAFFTALFFAAHPLHVESVTAIKNRTDLITLLFFVSGFMFFMKTLRNDNRLYLVFSLLCYAMTLLSKEMGITLPAVLILYVICFENKENWKKGLILSVPYWLAGILYMSFKVFVIKASQLEAFMIGHITVFERITVVIKTIAYYFKLLLFPFWLNAERMLTAPKTALDPLLIISFITLLVFIGIAVFLFKRSKLLFFALLWIVITLSPISNVFYMVSRPIAEQRMYIPSVGFCMILGAAGSYLADNSRNNIMSRWLLVFLGILALMYSATVIRRNADWKDSLSFFTKTAEASPNSARALNNLGVTYRDKGMYDDAVIVLKKALKVNPNFFLANVNLGTIYCSFGWLEDAKKEFAYASKWELSQLEIHNNLGGAYMQKGMLELAIEEFKIAISKKPFATQPHFNLGRAYMKKEMDDLALKEFFMVIELDRKANQAYEKIGEIYERRKKFDMAIETYQKGLEASPNYINYMNLGDVYNNMGQTDMAIKYYRQALKIAPYEPDVNNNIAGAYMKKGLYKFAISHYKICLLKFKDQLPVLLNLAKAYKLNNETDKMRSVYGLILKIDPKNTEAKKEIAKCKVQSAK